MATRAIVVARKGLVASSHQLASFWGAKTLSDGGNVVDAAIATSAMLCVTQNNMCGLGGDLFSLVKFGGKIFYLNGSGRASENATIKFYREEKKLEKIPECGPLAAPTVPGIVHAWGELHSKFGSIELEKLLAPAIFYAESGVPLTVNYSESIRASAPVLRQFAGWSEIFLPNGSAPPPGALFKQRDLASSLKAIAKEGVQTFYSGDLADRIVKGASEQGGLFTSSDFSKHTSTWSEPLKTDYRGTMVYETAPNSQAATVLLWLNMLEEYNLTKYRMDSAELFEIFLDTCLKSYAERAKHITDPAYHELPKEFTSKEFAAKVNSTKIFESFAPNPPGGSGDTTYFTVGNSDGDCASVIQSNFMGFGSGLVPKGTGIVLHNRGCYFTLDEDHHNALKPGKRTFHTLCASLGETGSGRTKFTLGSMGGDIQPQVHVQLMTKILDFGMDLQAAIDAPRFIIPFSIYERPSKVFLEPGMGTPVPAMSKIAEKAGLSLELFDTLSSLTGHAQAILFREGTLRGAADPRGDGSAVGF
ncbi:MAG: gamma-glutamyltransferase family protein [Thaumarchaeota archaeon]|nr:gamma-glutamyltransferase family protein [Nitrososphaerota archaeon]